MSDSTSGCLQAATIQSSIFARTCRLMARMGKHSNLGNGWLWMNPLRSCDTTSKCFSTASVTISGEKKAQSTWLSGLRESDVNITLFSVTFFMTMFLKRSS